VVQAPGQQYLEYEVSRDGPAMNDVVEVRSRQIRREAIARRLTVVREAIARRVTEVSDKMIVDSVRSNTSEA
jgi:hypothetical protein